MSKTFENRCWVVVIDRERSKTIVWCSYGGCEFFRCFLFIRDNKIGNKWQGYLFNKDNKFKNNGWNGLFCPYCTMVFSKFRHLGVDLFLYYLFLSILRLKTTERCQSNPKKPYRNQTMLKIIHCALKDAQCNFFDGAHDYCASYDLVGCWLDLRKSYRKNFQPVMFLN